MCQGAFFGELWESGVFLWLTVPTVTIVNFSFSEPTSEKGHVTVRWVKRGLSVRLPLAGLILAAMVSGCSKEERAASALAEIGEAYATSELSSAEKLTEFTAQYEALAEKYAGTQAALAADTWLMTGTSLAEEEAASAELSAIEEAYDDSELGRTEKNEEFTPRYEALAQEYWGTDAALEAKFWLMRRAPRDEETATIGEATEAIFERYARSPHIRRLGDLISNLSDEQIDEYFGDLRENSPHAEVRAAAIYDPARSKERSLRYGRAEDPIELREQLDTDFQLLIDEYGDVIRGSSTYSVLVDALLNPHTDEELAVGQPAPEIMGVTADGEEIRLSQFLGKVVVIDFWGDW